MKKHYSKKQKAEIITQYLSGKTILELSKEHGVARSTLYNWVNQSQDCQKQERKINL